MELGLQFPGGPARHDRELPAERRDAVRAAGGGLPRRARGRTSWPSTTGPTRSTGPSITIEGSELARGGGGPAA